MNEPLNLTSDEKLMGGVAHIFGPLVAIIVWVTQKEKSRFVKFQALQALAFDLFIIITGGLLFFCLLGAMFLGTFWTMFTAVNNASSKGFVSLFALPFMFPFITYACVGPVSLGILVLRLIAGVSVLNGRNYKYPIIGKWLENFLGQ
jgi:uncharacterized Tic20 family protein